jgi:hypothetical protein
MWGPITSHLGRAKNVLEAVKTNGALLSLDCAGQNTRSAVHSFDSTEIFILLLHAGVFMIRTPFRSFLRRTWPASFLLPLSVFLGVAFLDDYAPRRFTFFPSIFYSLCGVVWCCPSCRPVFSSSSISFIALLMRFSSLFRVSLLMLVMICSLFLSLLPTTRLIYMRLFFALFVPAKKVYSFSLLSPSEFSSPSAFPVLC